MQERILTGIRILQISSSDSPSGGAQAVLTLCRALLGGGHEVVLAAPPGSPLATGAPVEVVTPPLSGGLPLRAAFSLRGLVRRRGFEVVHAHTGASLRAAALARGPARLFWTHHHAGQRRRAPLTAGGMRRVDAILAPSQSVHDSLSRVKGIDPARVHVVPDMVDVRPLPSAPEREEARRKLGIRRRFALGVVGSMIRIKGQEEFVRAAGTIAKRRDDVEFLLVGRNRHEEEDYVAGLLRLRDELHLRDRVRLLDWRPDPRPVYAALDVLAVPSHLEAFGLSCAEAMAAGTPVVAAETGGLAEIVHHEKTGLLFPPGAVAALASALLSLLDSEPLRTSLATNARRSIAERFTPAVVLPHLESLYQTNVVRP